MPLQTLEKEWVILKNSWKGSVATSQLVKCLTRLLQSSKPPLALTSAYKLGVGSFMIWVSVVKQYL